MLCYQTTPAVPTYASSSKFIIQYHLKYNLFPLHSIDLFCRCLYRAFLLFDHFGVFFIGANCLSHTYVRACKHLYEFFASCGYYNLLIPCKTSQGRPIQIWPDPLEAYQKNPERKEIVTYHVSRAWQQADSPHLDVGHTVRNRDREHFIRRLFQITTMGRSFLIGFKRKKEGGK